MTRVTRRVPLVEQELLILLRYLNSTRDFGGVRGSRPLIFCLVFCRSLCVLLSFFAIVLSVLRFPYSDYLLVSSSSSYVKFDLGV